jgi:hypothetical protein
MGKRVERGRVMKMSQLVIDTMNAYQADNKLTFEDLEPEEKEVDEFHVPHTHFEIENDQEPDAEKDVSMEASEEHLGEVQT